MITLDTSKIPDFLETRRWFGGKGLPIKHVEVLDQAQLSAGDGRAEAFALIVLEVVYALGRADRYLAPLTLGEDGAPVEAMDDDDLARALLDIVRGQQTVPTGGGSLRGEFLGDGGALRGLSKVPAVRRIAVEQSNTSVVFDERVIMKLIRKLDLGYNPEWEMGRFLQAHGFLHTPKLLGGIVLEGVVHSTVAVVHDFVEVEADGWAWALARMQSFAEPTPDFLQEVKRLGACLGELHSVLASDPEEAAFAPEPVGREDLERWAASMIGELGVTAAAAAERIPELRRRHDALVERINQLAALEPSGLKIRLHGDLHLGQTLRAKDQWLIFDFEGEPARTYAQRREKHTPLRDVAGMLRSFAYASAAVEGKAPAGDKLTATREAFLEGYRAAARTPGLLPEDDETFRVMLETLELEKLLYEVRYELNHRPEWVRIPARTLLA